jgi:hypothetical protein
MRRVLSVAAVLVVALIACTGGASPDASGPTSPAGSSAAPASDGRPSVLPVPVSSELAVGANRFVFSFLDAAGNAPVAAPDRSASVRFIGPDGATVEADPAAFVWAIENERGVYVTHVAFPSAGAWRAEFTTSAPGAATETIPFDLDVRQDRSVTGVGEPAPSVDTPTALDVGGDLSRLSTDADPDPAFYEMSVADALDAGRPFVLVFATPKFCVTAQCGPTLDRLKPIAAAYPDVAFINVEPYELADEGGQLQPVLTNGQLTPVESVVAYGLLSEPYVFVIDAEGIVSASFEVIFSADEIEAALDALG